MRINLLKGKYQDLAHTYLYGLQTQYLPFNHDAVKHKMWACFIRYESKVMSRTGDI